MSDSKDLSTEVKTVLHGEILDNNKICEPHSMLYGKTTTKKDCSLCNALYNYWLRG